VKEGLKGKTTKKRLRLRKARKRWLKRR